MPSKSRLDRALEFDALFLRLFNMRREQTRVLAEKHGLSMLQTITLKHLEEPVPMGQLGEMLGFDPSYVTSIADGLEKDGLIERQVSVTDRRVKNLVLTPRGQKARTDALRHLAETNPFFEQLSEQEQKTITALFTKVLKGAGLLDP